MWRSNKLYVISALVVAIGYAATSFGNTIYVDDDAFGANNGTSWADAYTCLQDALADADTPGKPIEIRVAQGTYTPDQGAGIALGDRCATFQLLNGVTIRGGYAGLAGPDPDLRDPNLYPSILTGDLLGNAVSDEYEPNFLTDSALIVCGSYTDDTAQIDGFTVTNRHSPFPDCADEIGTGAIFIASGSPKILNCRFVGDEFYIASVAVRQGSWPQFTRCVFEGAGAGVGRGNAVFRECTFYHEGLACYEGGHAVVEDSIFENGGISGHDDASISVTRCTFAPGEVTFWGRGSITATDCVFEQGTTAVTCHKADLTISGCTFTGHERTAVEFYSDGKLVAERCVFDRNAGLFTSAITTNRASRMVLSDCVFTQNSCAASSIVPRNWRVVEGSDSCVLRNCTFVGNTGSCVITSGDGHFEAYGCTFVGNQALLGAAIQVELTLATIANCVFAGNYAYKEGGAISGLKESGVVSNCTFVGNFADEEGSAVTGSGRITDSILWNNGPNQLTERLTLSYSDVQGGWPGEGNIDVDPCFAEPGYWDMNDTPEDRTDDFWVDGDYHLMSQAGRWGPEAESWLQDNVTSPCIDAGDPTGHIGAEPFPNGGRVNMGAHAAGPEASKSYFGRPICATTVPGDINGDCVVDCTDFAIMSSNWLGQGISSVNAAPTVALIEPQEGMHVEWSEHTTVRATVNDSDGEIIKVRFKARHPYEYGTRTMGGPLHNTGDGWEGRMMWSVFQVPRGSWTVSVIATDNRGATGESEKVTIFVD